MSEISRDMNTSGEMKMGPDLFQNYIRSIAEFLSGDNFSPSSPVSSRLAGAGNGSFREKDLSSNRRVGFGYLFRNAAADGLSGSEKARLMSMLHQSVTALKREVDEISDPVFALNRLRGLLVPTKSSEGCEDSKSKDDAENRPYKRLKVPSSSSSVNKPLIDIPVTCDLIGQVSLNEQKIVAKPGASLTTCYNKGCVNFSKLNTDTQKGNPDESRFLCGDCLKQENKVPNHKDTNESILGSSSRDDKGNGEVNDVLQVLLVNRGPTVVEKLEKHAAELSSKIGHMEEKIEELLDIVISKCRPMTHAEKHHLRRLTSNLPPKNLGRAVEIIQRGKPSEKRSSNHVIIDLQHEDHLTLWRLYFYVKAVENAQKLLP